MEDLETNVRLHPADPRLKANCRRWIKFIDGEIVPGFYAVLAVTEGATENPAMDKLQRDITSLVRAADDKGPYFLGEHMCLVDVHLAPFALRMSRILQPLGRWKMPEPESRWQAWVDAMESNVHVRDTVSANSLYVETVEMLVKVRQAQVWD